MEPTKTTQQKRLLAALAITAGLLVHGAGPAGATDTQTICHDGQTIEVPHSLMWEHFDESGPPQPGHEGDTRGACPAPTVPCQEDEPCWDCSTMGNLICGPPDIGTPVTIVQPAPPAPSAPAPTPVAASPAFMG